MTPGDVGAFSSVIRSQGFSRDMKKLLKRFRSLEEDLRTFINASLKLFHKIMPGEAVHLGISRIPGLGFDDPPVYKVRKFACRSLPGTGCMSGIRVIYAYFADEDRIELIEIYYKGDKENEDRGRISSCFGRGEDD